jgi:hypothetical protein
MVPDVTIMIVPLWSSWEFCAGLWETSWAGETAAQLWKTLGAIFSQQWLLGFHKHNACRLLYMSLLQSQASLLHNMACIISSSLQIFICSFWLKMVVEINCRSTWRRPLREPRDAPHGGYCVEITEIDGRESTINIPPLLSWHSNGMCQQAQFQLQEHRTVRRYDVSCLWESMKSRKDRVSAKLGHDRVCIPVVW